MSKFFVGQRVRVVKAAESSLIGKETCIVGEVAHPKYGDSWELALKHESSVVGWTIDKGSAGSYLEPILPEGHRAGDFTNVQDLLDSLTREHA